MTPTEILAAIFLPNYRNADCTFRRYDSTLGKGGRRNKNTCHLWISNQLKVLSTPVWSNGAKDDTFLADSQKRMSFLAQLRSILPRWEFQYPRMFLWFPRAYKSPKTKRRLSVDTCHARSNSEALKHHLLHDMKMRQRRTNVAKRVPPSSLQAGKLFVCHTQ